MQRHQPRILCFSQSPFILLHEAALVRTLAPTGARVSLLTYGKTEPAMTEASRRMATELGMDWLTHLNVDLATLAKDVLDLSLRRPRPLEWIRARRTWRAVAPKKLHLDRDLGGEFDHVILPFMTQSRELWLANLVRARAFHFVIDGMMSYCERKQSTVKQMRRLAQFTSLRDPFADYESAPIYTYPGMDIEHFVDRRFQSVDREAMESVHDGLREAFRREIEAEFESPEDPATCVLLQSLAQCRNIDAVEEIGLFARVIEHEVRRRAGRVIVKPHPRRDPSRPAFLKMMLPDDVKERVDWIEPSVWWSGLPFETLAPILNIDRVAGLYSTSLFTLGGDPAFEAALYYDERFPSNISRLVLANRRRLPGLKIEDLHAIGV